MGHTLSFGTDSNKFIEASKWALRGYNHNNDSEYILLEMNTEKSVLKLSNVASDQYFVNEVLVSDFKWKKDSSDQAREEQSETVKLAVNGTFLSKALSVLPKSGVISIEEKFKGSGDKKNHVLELDTGSMRISVELLNRQKFPVAPDVTRLGEVAAQDLLTSIKSLSRIADISGSSAHPAVGALDFILLPKEERLTIMGTDKYVVSEFSVSMDPEEESAWEDNSKLEELVDDKGRVRFLIHADDISAISAEKVGPSDLIAVGIDSDGRISFSFEGSNKVACISRVDSKAINYHSFLTVERDEKNVTVNLAELEKAVKACKSLSWESDDIIVKLSDDSLVLTNKEENITRRVDYDDASENSEVDEDLVVHFASSVISKAFFSAHTEKVQLVWEDSENFGKSFFLMKPVLDSGDIQENVFILFVPIMK